MRTRSHFRDISVTGGVFEQPVSNMMSSNAFVALIISFKSNAANLGRRSRTQHLLVLRLSILVSVQRRRLLHYRQLRDRG